MARSRLQRLARIALKVLLGALTLVLLLLVLLVAALELRPVREFVRERANRALEPAFVGTVTLERIGSLGLAGVGDLDATVRDRGGRRVLVVRGLDVDAFWPRIVWTAVRGDGIDVRIDAVRLRHADVALLDDGTGSPTLATTFDPRPTPPTPPTSAPVEVRVAVGRIELGHAWIHGQLGSGPLLDGDVRRLAALLSYDKKGLVTKLDRADIAFRSLPEKLDPRGSVDGRLDVPALLGPRGSLRFTGAVAGATTLVEGSWDGTRLHALVRAPEVPAAVVRDRLSGLALRDPVGLEVTADGTWPEVRFEGALVGKPIHLRVNGTARFEQDTRLRATADARDVDLSGLVEGASQSSLGAHADVSLELAESGALDGEYRVEAPSGRLEATATPRLETSGRVRKPADGELVLEGAGTIDEPGAPTELGYRVQQQRKAGVLVHAELESRFTRPRRLAALGVRASGKLSVAVDFDSESSAVEAHAKLRAESVHHEAVRAHAVALDARLGGPSADPRLDAELTAGPVDALGRRFRSVALTASGRVSELAVHALVEGRTPERIELATRASFSSGARLEDTSAVLRDGDGAVFLDAGAISMRAGGIQVERATLRGAGTLEANLDVWPRRQRVEVTASELEVERLARLVGVRPPFDRARVSADISLLRDGEGVTGHARAQATEVQIGKLRDAGARADLVLTSRDVSGTAEADFGEGGRFQVELDEFELPKPPFRVERIVRQRGSVVARGDLRLRGFYPLIEATGLPIERVDGTATFDIRASGGQGASGPNLSGRIETKGLRVVERRSRPQPIRTTKEARQLEPRALEGVDVRALFELDSEERVARTDIVLFDPWGTILSLDGEARLPPDWTRRLWSEWRTVPLRATLDLPRRSFEIFPLLVRPAAQKGIASAHVELDGSIATPVLDALVDFDRLHVRRDDRPLKVSARAHYERERGDLGLAAESEGRSVGALEASWRGDLSRLARMRPGEPSPIVLDADGELSDFPTEAIPVLLDRQVRGPLRGTIQVRDLGRDTRLQVSLDGSKMTFGQVRLAHLRAELEAKEERAHARFLAGDTSGNVELDLQTSLPWRNRVVPATPTRMEGRVLARRFRLDTLSPAVSQYLNELGGRLDADLRMRLEPGNTELSGRASIDKGVVQIPALGQRLTDVKARVLIEGDRVVVDKVAARGPTGRLTARASARLDGLSLLSADAHLAIAQREKVPVTLEGASVGDAWGRADIQYRNREGATDLTVKVPSLHVELAEEGDLEVQSLDEVENIRIGARLRDGTFAAIPVQPLESGGEDEEEASTPMRVRVELGRDVEIQRGRALKVQLRGRVTMQSDGESSVTGRLELKGGTLDVQGKLFDIERGVVTFNGDPSNPTVTATARWDSPAGYAVYADYRGDVRTGKLTLHSEPPLTQDEIASLLLFGTPDGSAGASSGDTDAAATAVGVAGDTAARGINRALSNLTNLDVAARVDTSTGTARPELVVQLTPRVAARVTRAVGEPQAGQPPDRTFLTVEFRFTRSWSVSAVVGDHGGSGMDVIWRRRY